MQEYVELLNHILTTGEKREDRTGVGTVGVFGESLTFDLSESFPLLPLRKLHWKSIVYELLWFLRGDTNIGYLKSHGVSIWDEWADSDGELGAVYGKNWRHFNSSTGYEGVDQIKNLERNLKTNPSSRRLIVTAYNPDDLPPHNVPPACHTLFQCYVSNNRQLNMQMYQRSADYILGVPFNIASYALLNHILATIAGLRVGYLTICFGDVHVYQNHVDGAKELVNRSQSYNWHEFSPRVEVNPKLLTVDHLGFEDIRLDNYNPLPSMKFDIAV